MKHKHELTNADVDAAELKRSTYALFDECGTQIAFIENNPIAHDTTYTEILKSARGAMRQAMTAQRDIAHDPYAANPPIALALMHLKAQREMLERLLAHDGELKSAIAAVGADAHAGRVAAEKLADELEGWREWLALCVREGGEKQTDQAQADTPQMFVAVRDAIYQLWQRFNAEPADCEMPDGELRKPGQKRTYAECIEQYGATVIYTSPATGRRFYLIEYCPNAQVLEKTINAARMAETRKSAKNSPHKCRTRKRQK